MPPLIFAYFAILTGLAALGLHRLGLVVAASRFRRAQPPAPAAWPRVLVQLPLYNERFVAERLLRAVARLEYPRDRLRIQVLDDSTDETRWIVDRVVGSLVGQGIPVAVVRRRDRTGFKAGALNYGLQADDAAELVAIFDADFVPRPDFLRRAVPHLTADPQIGLVQARWSHLNRDASWLTRAQAVFLDGHFGVEHPGRAQRGHFFNFNGTAGVWRRRAIERAGGWSGDTITEDLDLSYRAQLAGWRFAFAADLEVPAELPATPSAFRSQQARWVRGSVETARKHLPAILSTPGLGWGRRLAAVVHLSTNFAYVAMAGLALLLPAAVVVRDRAGWRVFGGQALLSQLDLLTLSLGTAAMVLFYGFGVARVGGGSMRRAADVLFALCLGAGMCLSNAREALRGLRSGGSEFVRTPKAGEDAQGALKVYGRIPAVRRIGWEMAFAGYHGAALAYAGYHRLWGAVPFLALYFVGFGFLVVGAGREAFARRSVAPLGKKAAA